MTAQLVWLAMAAKKGKKNINHALLKEEDAFNLMTSALLHTHNSNTRALVYEVKYELCKQMSHE